MNVTISFENNDLASRSTAAVKRSQAMSLLANGGVVNFEFENVESISASYADELFGILVQAYGLEAISTQVRLLNCSDYCAKEIAEAMFRRSEKPNKIAC